MCSDAILGKRKPGRGVLEAIMERWKWPADGAQPRAQGGRRFTLAAHLEPRGVLGVACGLKQKSPSRFLTLHLSSHPLWGQRFRVWSLLKLAVWADFQAELVFFLGPNTQFGWKAPDSLDLTPPPFFNWQALPGQPGGPSEEGR